MENTTVYVLDQVNGTLGPVEKGTPKKRQDASTKNSPVKKTKKAKVPRQNEQEAHGPDDNGTEHPREQSHSHENSAARPVTVEVPQKMTNDEFWKTMRGAFFEIRMADTETQPLERKCFNLFHLTERMCAAHRMTNENVTPDPIHLAVVEAQIIEAGKENENFYSLPAINYRDVVQIESECLPESLSDEVMELKEWYDLYQLTIILSGLVCREDLTDPTLVQGIVSHIETSLGMFFEKIIITIRTNGDGDI
jgi:hypothetical protein